MLHYISVDKIHSFLLGSCVPYSLQACKDAVERLGLQKGGRGWSFTGTTYSRKGCFAYSKGYFANIAFYGLGGSEEQNKKQLRSPRYRPRGFDCSATGKILFYDILKSFDLKLLFRNLFYHNVSIS